MPLSALRQRIRRWLVARLDVPDMQMALARLKSLGFTPRGVIDVGASRGDFTRLCLNLWPDAAVTCIEPLMEHQSVLQALAQQYSRVTVHPPLLLGATPQEAVTFHEADTASSVLPEHIAQNHPTRRVPMTTLDVLYDQGILPVPDLLKLDVQGYELAVLQGATQHVLPRAQVIVAEVNLLDIHQDVPLLHHVVGWLADRGFVTYDVCGLCRRPLDRALWQVDLIFLPFTSHLRMDKRWSVA